VHHLHEPDGNLNPASSASRLTNFVELRRQIRAPRKLAPPRLTNRIPSSNSLHFEP
jgi:hypothetical protein